MGLKNPVGTKVTRWGEDKTIIGVVKDFHISSLHEAISPVVLRFAPGQTSTFMVKIAPRKERETIAAIEKLYSRFNPGFLFEYRFLDELYQAQYIAEQRVSVISKYFAALAIIISCLGLFGVATFNAEVRTKEIGIRKVLGASVSNVMVMLSKDFVLLIIIAMVIGFPIAWIAMNAWLAGFKYISTIPIFGRNSPEPGSQAFFCYLYSTDLNTNRVRYKIRVRMVVKRRREMLQ